MYRCSQLFLGGKNWFLVSCVQTSRELSGQGHILCIWSYFQLLTTLIFALQCHHSLWTRLEMLILWRAKMRSLPVLLKEHPGLKSGQFFKSHWNKSWFFPILHDQKSLLPFLSRLWCFLFRVCHLNPIPMWVFPDSSIPEVLSNLFYLASEKKYLQIIPDIRLYQIQWPDNI